MDTKLRAHYLRDEMDTNAASRLHDAIAPHGVRLTIGKEIPSKPGDIDILIAGRPSEGDVRACGDSLRAIIVPWAGIPPQNRTLIRDGFPHLALHNSHHNAVPTAELAVALLLAAAKVVVPLDQNLRKGDWSPRYREDNDTVLLHDETAVVLGYGAIGKHIGRILRGFGMHIIGVTRSGVGDGAHDDVEIVGPDRLPEVLPRARALMISIPHTDETDGMIGAEQLSLLPKRSILVNVSRGAVIDENALYDALQSKRLHAAGLDVWYQYPPDVEARTQTHPSSFPFHELDNVVLSPHRGGAVGVEASERMRLDTLASMLIAAAEGEEIPNRVNIELGY